HWLSAPGAPARAACRARRAARRAPSPPPVRLASSGRAARPRAGAGRAPLPRTGQREGRPQRGAVPPHRRRATQPGPCEAARARQDRPQERGAWAASAAGGGGGRRRARGAAGALALGCVADLLRAGPLPSGVAPGRVGWVHAGAIEPRPHPLACCPRSSSFPAGQRRQRQRSHRLVGQSLQARAPRQDARQGPGGKQQARCAAGV
ncbi:unnamed protein product, partial [Prorocentrum cordatum]